MSLRSKAKAEKEREKLRKAKQEAAATLARKAQELKTRTSGFARTSRTAKHEADFQASKMPTYQTRSSVSHAQDRFKHRDAKPVERLSEEMAAREQAAVEHYRTNLQPRVGQLYNKGSASQVMTESDMADMRAGLTRRRS